MKKIIIGLAFGFCISMGMRTLHSVLCNHYFNKCNDEHKEAFNPVACMQQEMGALNWLSTISGFPMFFFDKWEWYG